MFSEVWIYLLAAAAVGMGIGLLIGNAMGRRRGQQVGDEWQGKVDDVIRQRDRLTLEIKSLRTTIESQQGVVHQHEMAATKARTDLESAQENGKSLQKTVFALRSERENTKGQLSKIHNHLQLVTQQADELQSEFVKSGEFYKGELRKSFEKRQLIEAKLGKAKQEQDSYNNLLVAQRSEHSSVNKILSSAQSRLETLDSLEQNVIELEAENALLKHDAALAKQEIDSLRRDVAELDELRVQNKELAHCLESIENSRKQYESDASRYRDHANEAEQHSETLRMRLDEVELNFASIEKQQRQALSNARKDAVVQQSNGQAPEPQEKDDLQEIIGIGKVFERALHELGVFNFRQIASFDMSDIARVNSKLNEFKGRMEQDDWIGQAKELQFKKYG